MTDMRDLLDILNENDPIGVNDSFDLEIGEDLLIETGVVALSEHDDIIVEGDEDMIRLLSEAGMLEEEELDEGDVIRGRFPPKQQSLFPDAPAAAGSQSADVRMIPSIDTSQLYKEFIRQVNPRLIKTEDDFLTNAFNFLQGKKLGPVKPMMLYKMAEKMKQVHDANVKAGNMYETEEELAEVAKLAGLNWNDPAVRQHYDKPTIARVASGETEPVDRTDYDTPPAMRDPMQGKPGFEKRRASLMKQGILKALEEKMKMGADSDASAAGSFMMGEEEVEECGVGYELNPMAEAGPGDEPVYPDDDADDKRFDDLDEGDLIKGPWANGKKPIPPGKWPSGSDEESQHKLSLWAISFMDHSGYYDREGNIENDAYRWLTDTYIISQAKAKELAKMIATEVKTNQSGFFSKLRFFEEDVTEAKYQGREVPLGKPMKGDVKKSKVYVRKPNGKVVKVNFGDKNMKIKKSNPKRRKSFRARHNCKNPGPRWKARYWSCRAW